MDNEIEELLMKLLETQYKVFKEQNAKLNRLEKKMFIQFAILIIFMICISGLVFAVWWML
jgi:hypothetical protein